MINLCINNEFSRLKKVVLGISSDFGGCPSLLDAYDPKSKQHIINQTFPLEKNIEKELKGFLKILNKYDIQILQPYNIFNCNQIFTRDVGFVIENQFFISNMISARKDEILGFEFILKQINSSYLVNISSDIFVEGGDVVVSGDHLFIGYSQDDDFKKHQVSRTNKKSLDYFSLKFPKKIIIGFQLNKSDHDPYKNCLHLDCCFQPLGLGHVLVCPEGFKFENDIEIINNIFGEEKVIFVNQLEMYNMFSNIFSISKNIIVSDKNFHRLNHLLRDKGYLVEEILFSEISKMGGLLRCATLPLVREYEK